MTFGASGAEAETLVTVTPEAALGVDTAAVGAQAGLSTTFVLICGGGDEAGHRGGQSPPGQPPLTLESLLLPHSLALISLPPGVSLHPQSAPIPVHPSLELG